MLTALYIRTNDGVLLRFNQSVQVREWLASGRLALSDRFLDPDGTWRPLLDLLALDGAVVADAGDREELRGAVVVASAESVSDDGETLRVERPPVWAVTTDELIPSTSAAFGRAGDRGAEAARFRVESAESGSAGGGEGEPAFVGDVREADFAGDTAGDGGPVAWALPAPDGESTVPEAGPRVETWPSEESGDDTTWAAGTGRQGGSRWRRRLVKVTGILVLAVTAGFAAWHWAGVSVDAPLPVIPDPLATAVVPEPEPVPEPVPAVAPESAPEAKPEPEAAPAPEKAPAPKPEPEAAPAPAPEPKPAPAPKPESPPNPEPKAAPAPAPQPEAESRPTLAPKPAPTAAPAASSLTFDQHMARGNQLKGSDPRAAMVHFTAAAQAKPGQVAPVAAMGDCALAMGEADQAQRHYASALRIRESYGPALIGMARLGKRSGDSAAALRFYRRYLEVNSRGSQADEARAYVEAQPAP